MINFFKMHGLGNDFVIIDNQSGKISLTTAQRKRICDRHLGVGCDQLIMLEAAKHDRADIFMRIYNPDGGEAGACGNATRCVAHWFMNMSGEHKVTIETVAGLLKCTPAGENQISVDMGAPSLNWQDIPLSAPVDTLKLPISWKNYVDPVGVSIGNPHCVFFVDDCEAVPLETVGPEIEIDPLFPDRTNVEFVHQVSDGVFRMRVWERGAGITRACGSGACAVAVAAIRKGMAKDKVTIILDGGKLHIEWDQKSGALHMAGEVAYVFDGSLKSL